MIAPLLRLVINRPARTTRTPDAALLDLVARAKALDARAAEMVEQCSHLPPDDPVWLRAAALAVRTLPVMERLARQAAQMPAQTREGLRAKASLVLLLSEECDAAAGVLGVSLAADVATLGFAQT